MPSPALFELETVGQVLVVTPRSNLGELTFPQLNIDADVILGHYRESADITHVVIDFGNTVYFGSSTISVLLRIWRSVAEREGQMLLCNTSSEEDEILRVVHLDRLWPIVENRTVALDTLAAC